MCDLTDIMLAMRIEDENGSKINLKDQSSINLLEQALMQRQIMYAQERPVEDFGHLNKLLRDWGMGYNFESLEKINELSKTVSITKALNAYSHYLRSDFYTTRMYDLLQVLSRKLEKPVRLSLRKHTPSNLDGYPPNAFNDLFRFDESEFTKSKDKSLMQAVDHILTDLQSDETSLYDFRFSIFNGKGKRIVTPSHLINHLPTKLNRVDLEVIFARLPEDISGLAQMAPNMTLLIHPNS